MLKFDDIAFGVFDFAAKIVDKVIGLDVKIMSENRKAWHRGRMAMKNTQGRWPGLAYDRTLDLIQPEQIAPHHERQRNYRVRVPRQPTQVSSDPALLNKILDILDVELENYFALEITQHEALKLLSTVLSNIPTDFYSARWGWDLNCEKITDEFYYFDVKTPNPYAERPHHFKISIPRHPNKFTTFSEADLDPEQGFFYDI